MPPPPPLPQVSDRRLSKEGVGTVGSLSTFDQDDSEDSQDEENDSSDGQSEGGGSVDDDGHGDSDGDDDVVNSPPSVRRSSNEDLNSAVVARPRSTGAKALKMMKRTTASALSHLTTSTANAVNNVATAAAGGGLSAVGGELAGSEPISPISHFRRKRFSFSSTAHTTAIFPRHLRSKSVGDILVTGKGSLGRQSSLQELQRAEAAAATARALVGVDAAESDVPPPLMSLPVVIGTLSSDTAVLAQRDVVHEIIRLRSAKGSKSSGYGREGSGYSPVSLKFIKMLSTNNKIVVERKKIKVVDAVKDNMQTFYNPYAERRKKKEKTLVCTGEAHGLVVGFSNALSIPLEVIGCNLLFGEGGSEATSKR